MNTKYWVVLLISMFNVMLSFCSPKLESTLPYSIDTISGSPTLYPIQKGDKFGYINQEGTTIWTPQFEQVNYFVNGYAVIQKRGRYGIIDTKGKYVLAARYDSILNYGIINHSINSSFSSTNQVPLFYPFTENLIVFMKGVKKMEMKDEQGNISLITSGKYGVANKKGKIIISPNYDYIGPFSEGLAAACKDNNCEFIDKKGQVAFELEKNMRPISYFKQGLAAFYSKNNQKYGFVNKKGDMIASPQFENIAESNRPLSQNSNAKLATLPLKIVQKNGKWGAINLEGDLVIPTKYNQLLPISSLNCLLAHQGEKCIYLDLNGQRIPKNEITKNGRLAEQEIWNEANTHCFFCLSKNFTDFCEKPTEIKFNWSSNCENGFYLRDKKYQLHSPHKFEAVAQNPQLWGWVQTNGKWGKIDEKGQYLIEPKFDTIQLWEASKKQAIFAKKDNKWYLMNKDAVPLSKVEWGDILIKKNILLGKIKQKWGVWNNNARLIIPPNYDKIEPQANGSFVCKNEKQADVLDANGKKILETPYVYLQHLSNNLFIYGRYFRDCDRVKNPNCPIVKGLLDPQGKPITAAKYIKIIPSPNNTYHVSLVKSGLQGYLDAKGHTIIPTHFEDIEKFINGKALAKKDGKYGLIDAKGKWLKKPSYAYEKMEFLGNNAQLKTRENPPTFIRFLSMGKWGLMNHTGKKLLDPIFKTIAAIGKKAELASFNIPHKKSLQTALIDDQGQIIASPILPIQKLTFHQNIQQICIAINSSLDSCAYWHPTKGYIWQSVAFNNYLKEDTITNTGTLKTNYFSYEGEIKKGLANGKGKMFFSKKAPFNYQKYEGEFKYGVPHGQGKISFQDGSVYQGAVVFYEMHGEGYKTYRDGTVLSYNGDWQNNKPYGKGKIVYRNGGIYEGECKGNLLKNGDGKMRYANGIIHEGAWSNDLANGKGYRQGIKGFNYLANWKNDVLQGNGTDFYKYGHVQDCYWKNGKSVSEQLFKKALGQNIDLIDLPKVPSNYLNNVQYWCSEKQNRCFYRSLDKWGLMNREGRKIVLPKFDAVLPPLNEDIFEEDYAGVKINNQWGFIDINGKIKIPTQFQEIGKFKNGLAPAKINGKWGFIDKNGIFVIKAQYKYVKNFEAEYTPVGVVIDGKTYQTYINRKGNRIMGTKFKKVSPKASQGGIRILVENNKWGLVDASGYICTPPMYQYINLPQPSGWTAFKQNNKWGYLHISKNKNIPAQFDYTGAFLNGFAKVRLKNKLGLVDTLGNIVAKPKFDAISDLGPQLWVAKKEGKWTIINEKGAAKKAVFDSIKIFHKGNVAVNRQKKWGYINQKGRISIPTKYDYIDKFSEGSVWVRIGKKWGLIDTLGNTLSSPKFDEAKKMIQGFAPVRQKDIWGFIDKKGKMIVAPQFEQINYFSYGLASFKQDGKWGIFNEKGQILLKAILDFPPQFNLEEQLAIVAQNGRFGMLNKQMEFILNPEYEDISYWRDDLFYLFKEDQFGVVNAKGQILLEPTLAKKDIVFPINEVLTASENE